MCLCSCQARPKLTRPRARYKVWLQTATSMCVDCMDPCQRKSKTPRLIHPSAAALWCAQMLRRLQSRCREFAPWSTRATRAFIVTTPSAALTHFVPSASVAPPPINARVARVERRLAVVSVCGPKWITPSAMHLMCRKFNAVNCPRPSCWLRLWRENTVISSGLKAPAPTRSSARWKIFRHLMQSTSLAR